MSPDPTEAGKRIETLREALLDKLSLRDWQLLDRMSEEIEKAGERGAPIESLADLARRVNREEDFHRVLPRIEKRLGLMLVGRTAPLVSREDWELTPLGGQVCEAAQGIWRAAAAPALDRLVGGVPEPFDTITLAAAEAVTTYLLPDVMRRIDEEHRRKLKLLPWLPFMTLRRATGLLTTRRADLVVTWVGGGDSERLPPVVCAERFGREREVHVIAHARHPLARQMLRHQHQSGGRMVAPADLAGCVMAAPNKTQVRGVVETLTAVLGRRLQTYNVGRFPQALSHVCVTETVSLFPDWPWVLDRLRRDLGIVAFPLDLPEPPAVGLQALWRVGDDGRPELRRLVDAVRDTYARLCRGIGWQEDRATPHPPESLPRHWYCYAVTPADAGEDGEPGWVEGELELTPTTPTTVTGQLHRSRFPVAPATVTGHVVGGGCLHLTFTVEDAPAGRSALGFVGRRVRRGRASEWNAVCLVGHLAYGTASGLPVASPLVLCTSPLAREDCEEIVSRGLVRMATNG